MLSKFSKILGVSAIALASQLSYAQAFSGGVPAGWTGTGSYGASGADGVVTLAPGGGTQYGWVSSQGGVSGASPYHFGSETNASFLRSTTFAAEAGDALNFNFNYVTSDGAGFSDYAWARLLTPSFAEVALLFTARTTPGGNTVPGFGMPTPTATIGPSTLNAGAVTWAPLGNSGCYSTGCGYTGWVNSNYTIASSGNYILEFGVANWADTAWQSGLAFDGITVGGQPIPSVPEPESVALMLAGLGVVGFVARRKKRAAAI